MAAQTALLELWKYHRHPPAWFQHSVVFGQADSHQMPIVKKRLALCAIYNGSGRESVRDSQTMIQEGNEICVIDIFAEGWIR